MIALHAIALDAAGRPGPKRCTRNHRRWYTDLNAAALSIKVEWKVQMITPVKQPSSISFLSFIFIWVSLINPTNEPLPPSRENKLEAIVIEAKCAVMMPEPPVHLLSSQTTFRHSGLCID